MIALVAFAIAAGVADVKTQQIPNAICAALAVLGLSFQLWRIASCPCKACCPFESSLASALAPPAICLGFALLAVGAGCGAELAYRRRTGRRGMGLGDVKYLSAWATVLGPSVLVPLAIACLAGGLAARATGRRAFCLGPWASVACVSVVLALVTSG